MKTVSESNPNAQAVEYKVRQIPSFHTISASHHENTYNGRIVSKEMLEEFLLSEHGNPALLDIFQNFKYRMVADTGKRQTRNGEGSCHLQQNNRFDEAVWLEMEEEGVCQCLLPEVDNWICAGIKNEFAPVMERNFIVTFYTAGCADQPSTYPDHFMSGVIAKRFIHLHAGEEDKIKVLWPKALLPPAGAPATLLVSLISCVQDPATGRLLFEHRKIVQKKLF
jgi:hypothetical protein